MKDFDVTEYLFSEVLVCHVAAQYGSIALLHFLALFTWYSDMSRHTLISASFWWQYVALFTLGAISHTE
jgi:hypothetical protein